MTHVFPRHTKARLPRAVQGDGCYLIDNTGKRYLDASGGAAVSCLGHSDMKVRGAIHAQLDALAYPLATWQLRSAGPAPATIRLGRKYPIGVANPPSGGSHNLSPTVQRANIVFA